VAKGLGIAVRGGHPEFPQQVTGNAVFAERPIEADDQQDNLTDSFAAAEAYLRAPFGDGGQLDLRPRPGRLRGSPLSLAPFARFVDANRDFAGSPRDGTFLGAYAGPDVPKGGPFGLPPPR
jgi:hypothetical protein